MKTIRIRRSNSRLQSKSANSSHQFAAYWNSSAKNIADASFKPNVACTDNLRHSALDSTVRSLASSTSAQGQSPHPKLQVVVTDAFRRMFESIANEKTTLKAFFTRMDKDGNGHVDAAEFVRALENLGVHLTRSEMRLCIDALDVDGVCRNARLFALCIFEQLLLTGDGTVCVDEFVSRMNTVRREQLQGRPGASWQPELSPEDPIEVSDGIKLSHNSLRNMVGIATAVAPFLLMNSISSLQVRCATPAH